MAGTSPAMTTENVERLSTYPTLVSALAMIRPNVADLRLEEVARENPGGKNIERHMKARVAR
jgi:hypothetical protein